jgi:AAA+ superfamily predicted ATPase
MATNRIDILDPALLRPGRIDRKIEFPAPSEEARLDILKIHSRKMNLTRGINLRKIAEMMPGASGAEVKVRKIKFNSKIKFFHFLGCLYRSRNVCTSRTTCTCNTRRF